MADEDHIRHSILYEFQLERTASEAAKNICSALGEGIVSARTCQRWFKKFQEGNFSLQDKSGRGRVSHFDREALQVLLDGNPQTTQQELATTLNCTQKTISNQLRLLGKVQKFGKWVPHELSKNNRIQRVTICSSLLSRQYRLPFLEQIVTGDEKWVLYVNRNQTITTEVYFDQLERLNQVLRKKEPALINQKSVIFHHDNARPHTSKNTLEKLRQLKWLAKLSVLIISKTIFTFVNAFYKKPDVFHSIFVK